MVVYIPTFGGIPVTGLTTIRERCGLLSNHELDFDIHLTPIIRALIIPIFAIKAYRVGSFFHGSEH